MKILGDLLAAAVEAFVGGLLGTPSDDYHNDYRDTGRYRQRQEE